MDATPARPRLGELLLEKGLLTEEELEEALRVQAATGRPLGEVVTEELGLVSIAAMRDMLLVQQQWRPLGEMLVDRGLLTRAQLEEALAEQKRSGGQLGEVVRDLFHIASRRIQKVLDEQRALELELDQGYTSGLRNALQRRGPGRAAPGAREDGERSAEPPTYGLAQRLSTPVSEAHTHLAIKQVETSAKKIASLSALLDEQRDELASLREALSDRQLTIIELEQRVAELEALVESPAAPDPPA